MRLGLAQFPLWLSQYTNPVEGDISDEIGGTMLAFILALITSVSAQHVHHPKHNMILYGETEIYASHLVYTPPHNRFVEGSRARIRPVRK